MNSDPKLKPDSNANSNSWRFPLLFLAIILAIALAVGLGLGFGLSSSASNSQSEATSIISSTLSTFISTQTLSLTSLTSLSSDQSSLSTLSNISPSQTMLPTSTAYPPQIDYRHMCSGHGKLDQDGKCQCFTTEWTGPLCQWNTHPPSEGTQVKMWYDNRCSARPDADPQLVSAANIWFCTWSGSCHDILERTGIAVHMDPYLKSSFAFTYKKRARNGSLIEIPCESIRGYLSSSGEFVPDMKQPSLAWGGAKTGPSIWPGTTLVPATDFCQPGVPCCIAKYNSDGVTWFKASWGGHAIALQRLCSPKYLLKCPDPVYSVNCGWGYVSRAMGITEETLRHCNCLQVRSQYDMTFSGNGVDCSDILPGGPLADSTDLYWKVSWALNRNYQITGNCTTAYDADFNDNNIQLCTSTADSPCMIPYTPGIFSDWNGYFPGGHY